MKLTDLDSAEVPDIVNMMVEIDNLNERDVDLISNDIFEKQPFFLTVLLGYRSEVLPEELEEIMKMFFLIWEYFKSDKNVQSKMVSESKFENIQSRHIEMFKYTMGESDMKEISKIFSYDLEKIRSKALLTAILFRLNTRPVLMRMDSQIKGAIFMGIKSFIECFETD